MFTITFKGKPNPKDKNLVKIEMIFFRTGYNRTPKVIDLTGLLEDWDQKSQSFITQTSDYQAKNKALLELKTKYLKVAEEWETEGVEWSPIQWSHSLDKQITESSSKKSVKVLTISQCIDLIIEDKRQEKRVKNGTVITCSSTAELYKKFKSTIQKFTQKVYGRSFSSYFFNEIDEKFVKDFIFHIQEEGIKNGNKGGLRQKLGLFWGVFYYSDKMRQPHVNVALFENFKVYFQKKDVHPQTIPYDWIRQIEEMDKNLLNKKEQFHVDLFLFSFYAGGIAPIDMSYLTWDSIENGIINYERIKFPKEAEMPFHNKVKEILRKYKDDCYMNYVLPIFTHKQVEEWQKRDRLHRLCKRVNKTLRKVSVILKFDQEFKWYAARGTFITKMIDEGYHPVEVAKMAGNSPLTIYKRYYKQTDHSGITNHLNQML